MHPIRNHQSVRIMDHESRSQCKFFHVRTSILLVFPLLIILSSDFHFFELNKGSMNLANAETYLTSSIPSPKTNRENCACSQNETLVLCPGCQPTCLTPHPEKCSNLCSINGTCVCKQGFIRRGDGPTGADRECIAKKDCPHIECPKNSIYQQCRSPLESKCDDGNKTQDHSVGKYFFYRIGVTTLSECLPPGCQCAPGFVRHKNGSCIAPNECPEISTSKCSPNETLSLINKCDRKCGGEVGCDQKLAYYSQPTCICKDGFARIINDENSDGMGNCVKECDCPGADSSNCCPENETFVISAQCEASCTEPNKIVCKQDNSSGIDKSNDERPTHTTTPANLKESTCATISSYEITSSRPKVSEHYLGSSTESPETEKHEGSKGGCVCTYGFVRNGIEGGCIPSKECPSGN